MPKHEPDSLAILFPKPTESDFPHLEPRIFFIKKLYSKLQDVTNCNLLSTGVFNWVEYYLKT